jgi:hypothetical protein
MIRFILSLTLVSFSFAVGDYGPAFAAESATIDTIPQLAHLAITLLGMLVAGGLAYQAFDRAIAVDDTLTSPRYMTSPQQYRLGGWVYVAFACLFFFLLVLEHRDVLELAEPFKIIPDSILAAAKAKSASYLAIVVAIGAVYLALLKLEAPWNVLLIPRNLIRTCISVPELVRQIKTKIQYALCIPGDEILKVVAAAGGTVTAEDFGKDRSTPERKWAEICYMKEWLTRALAAAEDTPFFGEASFAFPTLMADFEAASGAMAGRKAGTASDQERAGLSQTIDALHGRLSRLVACYLVYCNSSRMALSTQARKFGVEIGPKYINPLHYWIIYVGVLVASVYVGVYVSAVVYDLAAGHGVVFDQSAERALTWSLYSISNYGFALILVLLMRFFVIPSVQSHLATYCWTFFLALFSGPFGLTAAIHFFGPDPIASVPIGALYYGMLQWGIGPALVSVYISYYLDRQTFDDLPDIVHSIGTIPRRVLNALAFAIGTGLLLLPALMGIAQQSDITWDLSKLRFVAAGSTFAVAFGLALAAQFALRKSKRRE